MSEPALSQCVDLEAHPLDSTSYRQQCKRTLDASGVLCLGGFLRAETIAKLCAEGEAQRHLVYFTDGGHNVYLAPEDPAFDSDHPRNRQVVSSKGCIQTDQIPEASALHVLNDSAVLREFLCAVLDEPALYKYADTLSSINLYFTDEGSELGWYFDNSSFAIALLIQHAEGGGEFEYVRDARNADADDMNYPLVGDEGSLVLFRGRDALHRVTPTTGSRERMLAVLA